MGDFCFGEFNLRCNISILNLVLMIYGLAVSIVISLSLWDSSIIKEMSMENVNAIGKAIGYVAIAGSLFFSLMWCLPFTPDSLIRAFVIMFCLIWLAKIGLEIAFLIEVSQVQPTLKEDIEKLLIRTILKAGGFPGKNMTYEEFNKLPSLGKEVGNNSCDSSCKASGKLMDSTQNKFDCCGIKKAADWYKVAFKLPASCCKDKACKKVNKDGCMSHLHHKIDGTLTWLFYTVIMAIFVQVVCIILSIFLFKLKKSKKFRRAPRNQNL